MADDRLRTYLQVHRQAQSHGGCAPGDQLAGSRWSASPDYEYHKQHPEEYAMHPAGRRKPRFWRPNPVAENPKLQSGAHLGSKSDVDQMARRFDRYPNFAVDTAARLLFVLQPPDKVGLPIKYRPHSLPLIR
jgi:hypothetical protein